MKIFRMHLRIKCTANNLVEHSGLLLLQQDSSGTVDAQTFQAQQNTH